MFAQYNLMKLFAALLICGVAGCQSEATNAPLTGEEAERATQEYLEQVNEQERSQQTS